MDVAVFVQDGVADLGLTAVLEAFATANGLLDELEAAPDPWQLRLVGQGDQVRTAHGFLAPTMPLAELPDSIGVLVVPAARVLDADALIDMVSAPANRSVLQLMTQAYESGVHLAAACTGTFYLAEAGVLDGAAATTSWWLGPAFRRRYPRIDLDEGRILCRAERRTTAGASLSHIDLALSLIAATSPTLAELTGRYLVVGDRRPQLDSSIPEVIARRDSLVAAFERWVRDHVAEQFRIGDAAHQLGVTERTLQRATQAEIGMSPMDFVHEVRLERATQLLRTTALTIDAISVKVGYLNAGTLRGLFRRRRGRSIAEVRASRLSW
ncbi:helix-turn-helix domain-containing protein [Nocardia sp. NBC_00565]|uniref:GlxA family transcriptional regulator n=1 Tax=Nocardia sp. NBC_00565 TaxID=2975993 RepID=UPI002E81E8C9|nr:helix-turn-helix domain-containing protein [Nocardia sp. NBC_00565]WUC02892.1 helix-turn-helix domain-containing protein [Nocardia sp. NBC_00565]